MLASCLLTYTLLVTVNSPRWDALVGVLPVVVTVLLTIRVSAAKATLGTPAIVLIAAAFTTASTPASPCGP